MSPLYPGADRPLGEAAIEAMRVMANAGERAAVEGMGAFRPLFERLPAPTRDIVLQMMLDFDPASVLATTRFLASGVQPMSSARDLAAIDAKVVILPGADPQHPREIAELYARNARDSVLVDQSAPDHLERIRALCDGSTGREP